MYTQCTKCRTIFEIDEDALQASLGIVRCGHCGERFDALRTLSGDLPTGSDGTLPEHDPEQYTPTLSHAIAPTSRRNVDQFGTDQGVVPDHADPAAAMEAAVVHHDTAWPASQAHRPARAAVAEPVGLPPAALLGDPAWLALTLPVQANYTEVATATIAAIEAAAAVRLQDGNRLAGTTPSADALTRGLPEASTAAGAALQEGNVADAPVAAEPVYIPPRRRVRRSTWLCASGCVVLALTLVAQVAWARRAALVRDAATQPWALALCARLDCRLPPIRDLAKLELVSRDVRATPHAAGALTITATVRNTAAFRQPWPVLVVKLTDLDDQVVAMRRFVPADYVPDTARRRAGIAPGTTAAIAFEVTDPGKRATGFHFGFE